MRFGAIGDKERHELLEELTGLPTTNRRGTRRDDCGRCDRGLNCARNCRLATAGRGRHLRRRRRLTDLAACVRHRRPGKRRRGRTAVIAASTQPGEQTGTDAADPTRNRHRAWRSRDYRRRHRNRSRGRHRRQRRTGRHVSEFVTACRRLRRSKRIQGRLRGGADLRCPNTSGGRRCRVTAMETRLRTRRGDCTRCRRVADVLR